MQITKIFTTIAVWGALEVALFVVAVPATTPASVRTERPFVLTFWCGPPLSEFDDARAAEIAAAGFNVVGPPCEGPVNRAANLRALDVAQRHGLRMWIRDRRFDTRALKRTNWEERLATAVADYHQHPAVDGYFVEDEPPSSRFEATAAIVNALRDRDPKHLAYVNLLPDYVSPQNLGARDYEEYVNRFVAEVKPQLISYDYYPFRNGTDRPSFFANLTTIRAAALRHGLPFMLIVQAMPQGSYRNPTEAEFAWQVFHALAFGARGISYFTYWTPPMGDQWNNHNGLIEDGRPTLHYFQAARLNQTVQAFALQLAPFRSLTVADSEDDIGIGLPFGPFESIDGGPVTVGLFVDADGRLAALLVNRDYRYGVTARLQLRPGGVVT